MCFFAQGRMAVIMFKKLSPGLDMISIGPDISDPHTVRETLYLDSIPKVWRLLEGILIRIGE